MVDKIGDELPRVSIVIPCYNHERFVKEAIQSVIDQDYQNIELIIIDDGSSDGSVKEIQSMVNKCEARFVRFEFRHRPNKGLCLTLNEALEWCQGKFLSGVASDDTLKPYKTRVQVDYLIENPGSIGVFGGVELVYEETGMKEIHVAAAEKYSFNEILLNQYDFPSSTSLLRIEPVIKLGGYKEAFLIEDWSLWLFLTEHGGTLDYIDMVLGTYRRHKTNFSLNYELMIKGRLEILELFKDHPLYKKALTKIYIISMVEYSRTDRYKSFYYFLKAISLDTITVFKSGGKYLFQKIFSA